MDAELRPRIVVSKCLGFEACRYDAQTIADEFVKKLGKHVYYVPVCPEIAIGLGVPRFPVRILSKNNIPRLVQPATGRDLTKDINDFSQKFLSSLEQVDGFILKFRSPSCGIKDIRIYAKTENSPSIGKGSGFFGEQILKRFPSLAIEDEGRLKSLRIRDHFLTKLFTLARFRTIKKTSATHELVRFHTENKFLLMTYNQREMRILGNIVANHEKRSLSEVITDYENHLHRCINNPPKQTSTINVLMHMLGYFKELSRNERHFFLEALQLYREGRVPLTSTLRLLKSWAIRFRTEYLLNQTLFDPYPVDLIEWSDAGRPIEL